MDSIGNFKLLRDTTTPIYYTKSSNQIEMERTRIYKALSKNKALLTEDFLADSQELIMTDEQFSSVLDIINQLNITFAPSDSEIINHQEVTNILAQLHHPAIRVTDWRKYYNKFIESKKPIQETIHDFIKKISQDILNDNKEFLSNAFDFASKYFDNIKLTETQNIFICNCGNIFTESNYNQLKRCPFCEKEISTKDCDNKALNKLSDVFVKFIQENIWLEEGIGRVIRQFNYKTLIRAHIMGFSGVTHEIDIFGYNKKKNIIIECKNTKVCLTDFYKSYCKKIDIPSSRLLVISTGQFHEDVIKFADYHGIITIPEVLQNYNTLKEFIN